MTELVVIGLYALVALVWVSIATVFLRMVRRDRPRSTVIHGAVLLTTLMAAYYLLAIPLALIPAQAPSGPATTLQLGRNITAIVALAVFRHLLALAAIREPRPRTSWLVMNYGVALLVAIATSVPTLVPARMGLTPSAVRVPYFVVILSLALRQMLRLSRRGTWRAGGLGDLRRADVAVFVGNFLVFGVVVVLAATGGWRPADDSLAVSVLDVGLGLSIAVPFAVRTPSEMVPRLLSNGVATAVAAALYVGGHALRSPELGRVVDLGAVLGLVVVLGPGRAWLSRAAYRIVLRRGRRRRENLQAFLHGLSPELGVVECCRHAVDEVRREMQIHGAAILLRTGDAVVSGSVAIEPLARVWPRDAAADILPTRPFGTPHFWDLPVALQDALNEADVVGVLPIVSPRGRRGHLFATAGYMAPIYSDEDVETSTAFADQLALVLDAAELITRTVAVERSLAHAEKLAAIGETAARIAHEMRNPVAAARSLAAQLAREPGAPFRAEHDLILTELERVEHQVTSLLRFARREELRLERLDLGTLVGSALEPFRAGCAAAGIALEVALPEGVTVSADREKLRQVILNLVENAIDALADVDGVRRLSVAVGNGHAAATLSVRDTGRGAPPDALPRLFEPFFSLKEHGTGLGLAIAKHTIEAHGGRIAAERGVAGGMVFHLELPVAAR